MRRQRTCLRGERTSRRAVSLAQGAWRRADRAPSGSAPSSGQCNRGQTAPGLRECIARGDRSKAAPLQARAGAVPGQTRALVFRESWLRQLSFNKHKLEVLEQMIAQRRDLSQVGLNSGGLLKRLAMHHLCLTDIPLVSNQSLPESDRLCRLRGFLGLKPSLDGLAILGEIKN